MIGRLGDRKYCSLAWMGKGPKTLSENIAWSTELVPDNLKVYSHIPFFVEFNAPFIYKDITVRHQRHLLSHGLC